MNEGERIEDQQYKGLRILVNERGFRYGTDSVLLAGFARANAKERVADLGSGTGVIAILLSARTGAELTAIEIQPEQCDMARRSAAMNGQEIAVIEADMRKAAGLGPFDAAVCNPPYYPAAHGRTSEKGEPGFEGAATHELYCTLGEVAESAARLIKYGGRFYMCCPAARLSEALCALTAQKLEPKRMRLVASRAEKAPYLALIEAKKGAAPGMIVERTLVVCNEDGSYTDETRSIYHLDENEQ